MKHPSSSVKMRGFTLVEMSIVLVIIGLIVGGVLAGKSLVHSAEIRSVTTEYNRYKTAMDSFRDKYLALPGDMPNAVQFWGAAAGVSDNGIDATCAALAAPSTTMATCNGDGNRRVGYSGASFEMFRAWQHLVNAGLIEGNYTGIAGSGSATDTEIGSNAPVSKVANAGWSFIYIDPADGSGSLYAGSYGNVLYFGTVAANDYTYEGALLPEDAYNLDRKMDDGSPAAGRVLTHNDTSCVSGSEYRVNYHQPDCMLIFVPGY